MKKVILLCLLIPVLASGQDSIKVRRILEKSIQAMSLEKYNTLEYNILSEDYSYSESKNNIYCKAALNPSTHSIQQLWAKSQSKSKKYPPKISFFDRLSDTAFFCDKDGVPDRVGNYKFLKGEDLQYYWGYEYFISAQSTMKRLFDTTPHPFPNKKDTIISSKNSFRTFSGDSILRCKGVVKLNGNPCYLIERISVNYAKLRLVVKRYPDYKEDAYENALHYSYFYIDTTDFMLRRYTTFSTAKNQKDTTFYKITTLISYKPNTFSNISFAPKNAQKVMWSYYDKESDESASRIIYLEKKAPDVKGTNSEGKDFVLYEQKAKYYVLEFLSADRTKYADSAHVFLQNAVKNRSMPNIQFVYIDSKDKADVIKKLSQERNISIIKDSKAAKKYGIKYSPATYILDENFNILYAAFGGIWDRNKKDIEDLLSTL